jgi:hypothetical protein
MTTATKLARQKPDVDPFSAVGAGKSPDATAAVETIRSCFRAMLAGEEFDAADFAAACAKLELSEYVARSHFAALKSAPDVEDDLSPQLEAAGDKWQRLLREYNEADRRLTQLRRERDAAEHEVNLIRDTQAQSKSYREFNPFLFGSLDEAARVAKLPGLLVSEVATIVSSRDPIAEAINIREQKVRAADEARLRKPPINPNSPRPPITKCDPPATASAGMQVRQVNNQNWNVER